MADSKVKAAAQKVEAAVEKVVDKIVGRVEVELKEFQAGIHHIFHAKGTTEFVNGVATVSEDVAKLLKDAGHVK